MTKEMTKKKIQALRVPLPKAEEVRRYLKTQHLLREDVILFKEDSWIYFPLNKIENEVFNYPVVRKSFEERIIKTHYYKDLVKLPKKLQNELPTSYDIIGSVILIKLPVSLSRYRGQIGMALLETHKHIRTVCMTDAVAGELRTRKVTIIAGEKQTLTTHTEYGLGFSVDVAKTYFSPRLASERRRVALQVKPGEIIVDLFAGVAPFSIMIARFAKPKIVYAIDKNKNAITLAKKNVKQNHLLESIEVVHADAKDAAKIIPVKADRIIMNLPFSAFRFFPVALSIAASSSIINYYDILHEEEIDRRIISLKKIAQKQGFLLREVVIHKIKSYAPREFYIGLDITATKHADVA
jgi:tRNA (guanine37-N1)-methyltransferase